MKSSSKTLSHPGSYIRQLVIPEGVSVTAAAKLLGVGRVALSNLLNGKSSLSPEMAVRLEKTFGVDQRVLLEMQTAYDQQMRSGTEKEVAVRAFVPNFLTIKANQIEGWADSIDARTHLPVLLRKLIHSTGTELHYVDFPGYDNSQRKGNDGIVKSGVSTPWIPEGNSYWEFGTDKDPKKKANKDYNTRLTSVDKSEREESTFVFVTPRNWHEKTSWAKEKSLSGDWKSVLAFDASDLEQWLEQSVPAQIWLAEQLILPHSGYETLEQAWNRWANASDPHLTPEIFAPSISAYRNNFKQWLTNSSQKPFVIAADSRDEALAFLACLFDTEELNQFKDLTAIFTSPTTLKIVIASSIPFISIVHSEDVERELSDVHRRLHSIIFRPRNAVDSPADISLGLLDHEAFRKALLEMGIDESNIEQLARESGYSPTILRRRLSKNDAIRKPSWSADYETAKSLVPIALIGAWHAASPADCDVVSSLADGEYSDIENNITRLLQFEDSPVWSVGHYRGAASKIDALFAIARMITPTDINRFFSVAEIVLSENDPSLELPEEERLSAVFYGKKRNHSAALREGICETLVILSVHGNNLLQIRTGIDIETQVTLLIRKLLTPLTLEKLLNYSNYLPFYAEAAPNEFLEIIEKDIRQDSPTVHGLLKPVDSSIFGASPSRAGLLWALECLAWKHLPRVSLILASLSQLKIEDNWINKPEASLDALFRSWMPQTAASLEQRNKALEILIKRFPEIAWNVCIAQIQIGTQIGSYSYKPRWRNDASGVGQGVSKKEVYGFCRKALDLLLAWQPHTANSLGELVESIRGIPDEDQIKVWHLINDWANEAEDVDKAILRERIRCFAFTRRGRRQGIKTEVRDQARKAYNKLQPHDLVIRYSWLFANRWIQESADELEDDDFDYQKHEERVSKQRRDAIIEIWNEQGFSGISKLLTSNDAGTVGHYLAMCLPNTKLRCDFIQYCLSFEEDTQGKVNSGINSFLYAIDDHSRAELLEVVLKELSMKNRLRILLCAPFHNQTWRFLDQDSQEIRMAYWKHVAPLVYGEYSPAELIEIVGSFLEVNRPRAAFNSVRFHFDSIESSLLKRLLYSVATDHTEPLGHFNVDAHHISDAIESLDKRPNIPRHEIAQLEFFFLSFLDHSRHGIPNLENQIAQSPSLFVQAVGLIYSRDDEGDDPENLAIEDKEQRRNAASAAYRLLKRINKIPGTEEDGHIDKAKLAAWVNEAKRLFREYGRVDAGDLCIGELLAKSRVSEDGLWPCESVCEVMEEVASSELGRGFQMEAYNSRGVHWRGKGGDQERELAAKYRAWAERLYFDYPFVGGILESLASDYEREARWEDSQTMIESRLRH